jgi:putative ABC transport system permease protein
MRLSDVFTSSLNALRANRVRTLLTALGLVIGNMSVILVVTISLTSTQYILEQIRGVGSNVVWAYYEAGTRESNQADADFVKIADVEAVRRQLGPRINAATGVMSVNDRVVIDGKEQDTLVLGADEYYPVIRNFQLLAGKYIDSSDVALRQKVAMLTEKLALRLYGSQSNAIGQTLKVKGIQFTVVGTFKEKTQSFGLSELAERAIVIPITVARYFTQVERIDPMYVQARRAEDVIPLTAEVRSIIELRHRAGARYFVDNLGAILQAAENIGLILTIVLILVSLIALVISGIGIMNIMLVTVTERTKEIGLRMAVGAGRKAVMMQFLLEACIISVAGGSLGVLLGIAIPASARLFVPEFNVQVSGLSVIFAFLISFLVGIIFGLLPASRASRLNPTEALRYE